MGQNITLIQGHPDPADQHFGHALAEAYAQGARDAGHDVQIITVAQLDFPLLRSQQDWTDGNVPESLRSAQDSIGKAQHLVFFYPLWLGTMPALLKAFLEQVLRPGFAIEPPAEGKYGKKLLTGKSARIVITMGMPVLVYRWYFRAHSLKNLERNILRFCGIRPIRESLFGMIEAVNDEKRSKWLEQMRELGRQGR